MKKLTSIAAVVVVSVMAIFAVMAFDINHSTHVVTDQTAAFGDGGNDGFGGGGEGSGGNDGCGGCQSPEPGGENPGPTPDNNDPNQSGGDNQPPPPPPPPPPPTVPSCTISSDASVVTVGNGFTLTWSSQNASAATMTHFGTVNPTDTRLVGATTPGSFTFSLDVSDSNGQSANCAVTVTVQANPSNPAPTCAFTPGARIVTVGQPLTLAWTSTNAVSATLSTFGAVGINDNRAVPTGTAGTFTYTLHVTGNDGQTNNCHATVTVNPVVNPAVFSCPNNVSFTASPSTIDEGQNTTLVWSVTGATSVAIDNGINTTNAMSGSQTVSPGNTTTYNLTASNGTNNISCPVTVTVDEDNGGGSSGGSSAPRCTLKASDRSVKSGDRVTLTWTTSNATKVVLKDNHGKTVVTTEGLQTKEKKDLYDDSVTVRPTRDTTYKLTASRGSRDRHCEVKIDVDGKVTVTEVRDQLPTTIALDDVPYTGVDTKTAVQFTLLALMALWGAYLGYSYYRRPLVVKK